MRITHITARSFLGLSELDIAVERQVLLISGPEASGKTSVVHALRFALSDELCRVELKKDIKALIRDGAKLGHAAVTIASGVDGHIEYKRSAETGNHIGVVPPAPHHALRFVLDQEAFTVLDPNERRAFLFKLMGLGMCAADIAARLEARGHSSTLVRALGPYLRRGFALAASEAQGISRELKGQWRGTTGENYGEVKAESWRAAGGDGGDGDIAGLRKDLEGHDEAIADLTRRLGAAEAQERASTAALHELASRGKVGEGGEEGGPEELQEQLGRLDKQLGRLHQALGEARAREEQVGPLASRIKKLRAEAASVGERARAEAKARENFDSCVVEEMRSVEARREIEGQATFAERNPQGVFEACPVCGASLCRDHRGQLKPGKSGSPEDLNALAAFEAMLDERKRAHQISTDRRVSAETKMWRARNALAAAKAAEETLASMEAQEERALPSAKSIASEIDRATAERDKLRARLKWVERARTAREALMEMQASGDDERTPAELATDILAAKKRRALAADRLAAAERGAEAREKTARARALHEEIKAMAALAADLAPDGLPSELLAKAMGPINERLIETASMTGWPQVSIDTEEIRYGGRHWRLISASERWRAQAMIAEAISRLSGIGLFVLDGLDILVHERMQAIAWLTAIAPEHDTILVTATLKVQPVKLPERIQSVWLGAVPE